MKNQSHIYVSLFLLLIIIGCSTRKNAFLNRGFHSVTTKYNILYNGNLAFEQGIDELYSNYKEDYWKRLPIERLEILELALPGAEASGANSNASFDKAEEKAVKAIQKHSMNISGKERNQQTDDAFLLLGKARYYSQRFVPALDAFNYVVMNYPKADLMDETRIWQAKSHLRLQNEELALSNLKKMLETKELLAKDILEKVHTALAMVYTEMDSTSQVIYHLKEATLTKFDREQTARNTYILGQIYRERNEIDSSNLAFDRVIDMKKIPYRYQIHSEIEKAKNLAEGEDTQSLVEALDKLIKNRDNRPYLDELHYHTGLIHQKSGRVDLAEEHFIASAHALNGQPFQIGLSYEELGNLQFDRANYVAAGSYYDSVLQIPQDRNTKRMRRLERKRNNLEEVIYFEGVSRAADSVLSIVDMTLEEQVVFFQGHIDALIAKEALVQEQQINAGFGGVSSTGNQPANGGKWYFYNTQMVGFGAQEFQQIWGNRPLEDNWRLSDKSIIASGSMSGVDANVPILELDQKYEVASYIALIPTEEKQIDSIKKERDQAYYQLGIIYKEQFSQNDIASARFEDLLSFEPVEKYILSSKYYLFKIYSESKNPKAQQYKEEIIRDYPDSKYAQLILHPNEAVTSDMKDGSPENVYKEVYYAYQEGKYDEVIRQADLAIGNFFDADILPKFELLKAYAIGKRNGEEAFRKALEFVALTYSNTEEGKKATEVIETLNKI